MPFFPNSRLSLEFVLGCFVTQWSKGKIVRLNLFNHVLALFHAKFACNLAITYPLVGEIYVRIVCKRVWRKLKMCVLKKSLATGSHDREVAKGGTHVKHTGELKGHDNWSTTRQNFQFGQAISSQLVLVASLSRQNVLFGWNMTFRIPHTHHYKYPYTHEM